MMMWWRMDWKNRLRNQDRNHYKLTNKERERNQGRKKELVLTVIPIELSYIHNISSNR